MIINKLSLILQQWENLFCFVGAILDNISLILLCCLLPKLYWEGDSSRLFSISSVPYRDIQVIINIDLFGPKWELFKEGRPSICCFTPAMTWLPSLPCNPNYWLYFCFGLTLSACFPIHCQHNILIFLFLFFWKICGNFNLIWKRRWW